MSRSALANQISPEKIVEELHPKKLTNAALQGWSHPKARTTRRRNSGPQPRQLQVEEGISKFDLTLYMIEEAEGLRARLEYNSDLFDAQTVRRMLGHLQVLLEAVVADPDQRLSALPLLTAAERHQLLVEWNDTRTEFPKDSCLHELFERQAEAQPDAVAAFFEDKALTYGELNRRANQLAHICGARRRARCPSASAWAVFRWSSGSSGFSKRRRLPAARPRVPARATGFYD